ncbi:MAG: type I 3-dehydroquinate dehydratase [bacterium]
MIRLHRADRTLRVGSLVLGAEPRIVAVVAAPDVAASARRAREQGAHLVEVRLDRDPDLTPERAVKSLRAARAAAGLPLVATIRLASELGEWRRSDDERLPIFAAAAAEAELVDVELAARGLRERVVALAAQHGHAAIVSHHDVRGTPSETTLAALAAEAVEDVGAAVFKVCPTAAGPLDVARLLSFVQAFRDRHETAQIVGMALGPEGSISRIMGPVFGSCMTYGFVEGEAPAAPGQLPIRVLRAHYDGASFEPGLERNV